MNFGIRYNLFIASNFAYSNLIMVCYFIILGNLILKVFVHTYDIL
jgi:hypothetical protein